MRKFIAFLVVPFGIRRIAAEVKHDHLRHHELDIPATEGQRLQRFYSGLGYSHPCITYPDPVRRGENLDTPHWEGLRQGWIDFRYCRTLALMLEKSPKAEAVRRRFEAMLNSMPWGGNVFRDGRVTSAKCDRWRAEIAAMIAQLRER